MTGGERKARYTQHEDIFLWLAAELGDDRSLRQIADALAPILKRTPESVRQRLWLRTRSHGISRPAPSALVEGLLIGDELAKLRREIADMRKQLPQSWHGNGIDRGADVVDPSTVDPGTYCPASDRTHRLSEGADGGPGSAP